MNAILKIENLSKSFGDLRVIDGLDMQVPENTVFGFVGRNGAGKTTTMKIVLGFLKPDNGNIFVCGDKVKYGDSSTNKYIGYLPDEPAFYDYMTPKQYLRLCGQITGLTHEKITEKTDELLPMVGLEGINRSIKGFSRGMKQRLGVAQALLNEPVLLICDEPTSALDPIGRKEILDILKNVKNKTTIIFSTHILSDVERICDTVGILNDGRIVLEGPLSKVKSVYRDDRIYVELQDIKNMPAFSSKLQELPEVKNIRIDANMAFITTSDASATSTGIIKILADAAIPILRMEILEPDLEQIFMEAIRK
jgi:ABC-2 type transport system ATP-binding protein